jgi:hypothetical protein
MPVKGQILFVSVKAHAIEVSVFIWKMKCFVWVWNVPQSPGIEGLVLILASRRWGLLQ